MLRGAVENIVASAGVDVRAEGANQVRVAGDVLQAVEEDCPLLVMPGGDEVRSTRVLVGAEGGAQVRVAGDVIQPVELDRPALPTTNGQVMR